ncbi:hypothetical protein LTR27_001237 [Elasticomyces elasticus]|nr:hypothetical protein LTR27_001237 [Elasticomyces elasticus]
MATHGLAGHGKAVEVNKQDGMELQDRSFYGEQGEETLTSLQGVLAEDHSSSVENQDHMRSDTQSTVADEEAMKRMGKDQQLVRQFRLLAIASFTAIAMATWEIGFFAPIYLSMAEMASMAPIAGAQYHWVSEFAPESCQRFLSYITGYVGRHRRHAKQFLISIAMQLVLDPRVAVCNAIGIFIVGSLIQTIISINDESYGFAAWQCTLLAFGAMLIAYCGSVYGSKALPHWQNAVFAVHIMAYFAYIIPIWVSAPTATHKQVWTEFSNEGGWSSMGLTVLIGQLTGISQQVGLDTAAHMSEEVRNASASVPKAMLYIYVCNFFLMFPAFLMVSYHIPDIDTALNDSTTYPAIYVLRQSMSPGWVTVILVIILLLNIASNMVYLTAVSRDLFAFARDKGKK